MRPRSDAPAPLAGSCSDADAWDTVLAAARSTERLAEVDRSGTVAPGDESPLRSLPVGHADALVTWNPGAGWEPVLPKSDPRHALIELYLPICSATKAQPMTVGHLGQSLDGFIATEAGESQYVTGQENILHLHRMRALCDAVIVGAGTVAADDPQLTTRHVAGTNALRVVLDPTRRLDDHYRVFSDNAAETLYVCAQSTQRPGERHFGRAHLVTVDDGRDGVDVAAVLRLLRARGCTRVFVEGGGVTVSAFLEANLLDRLHVAIAPLIIGNGRPAIRLSPRANLSECRRPPYRVFRMGGDILFDCNLRSRAHESGESVANQPPTITRVI